jgi:spermidine synthase
VVNALAGVMVVLWLFGAGLGRAARFAVCAATAGVLAVLGGAFVLAGEFEISARQALYDAPVVHAERTPYQEIVMTRAVNLRGAADLRLFLNGDLQFSSTDEYRYHEALVHPAMAGSRRRVLVLGGGDGLAAREVLRYPDVAQVVQVELDPAMVRLARDDPALRALNRGSLDDPRLRVVHADAMSWLRGAAGRFDVVVADLPDPDAVPTAKLYSVEFYTLARRVLAPGGRLVVQAGSPYFAPRSYWCVAATLRAAGLPPVAYQVDVPSFGAWGYLLAGPEKGGEGGPEGGPPLVLDPNAPRLRFLTADTLRAAAVFPADRPPLEVPPSTLMRPRILAYHKAEWRNY